MPKTQNRAVMIWIFAFGSVAVFLVIFGGFVRLTRSGLSIAEWNPVMGAVPPLNQQAWQTEFAHYQLTPEFQKVNYNITLDQYKEIFMIEWFHRFIARIAGFVFAIPFFVFALKKTIPWKEIGLYVVMGILFLAQAILGWIMVASGLVAKPREKDSGDGKDRDSIRRGSFGGPCRDSALQCFISWSAPVDRAGCQQHGESGSRIGDAAARVFGTRLSNYSTLSHFDSDTIYWSRRSDRSWTWKWSHRGRRGRYSDESACCSRRG